MKNRVWGVVVLAVGLLCQPAWSADHSDGPAVLADPAADINDVYAWMSLDEERVNLVMTVYPGATDMGMQFSDRVQYVFQTMSNEGFGMPFMVPPVNVIAEFDSGGDVSVWAGDAHVNGDAKNADAVLVSEDGRLKVFTGLRKDPFFFNRMDFNTVAAAIGVEIETAADAPVLMFDAAGCPTPLVAASADLADGNQAAGNVADEDNTLAIVISIDKSLLTQGGPALALFGSTHRAAPSSNCFGDANSDGEVMVNEAILVVNNILEGCQPSPALTPPLGVQIDRMGRPAINIAAVDPFFTDRQQAAIQDDYNADADVLQWVENWAGTIAGVIAVYDGLDGTCGNQFMAGDEGEPGRYSDFAALLAADTLHVNTDFGICEQYFGVERDIPGDCGGRKPLYDTIDVTYSLLVAGETAGFADEDDADDDVPNITDGASSGEISLVFPFLNAP